MVAVVVMLGLSLGPRLGPVALLTRACTLCVAGPRRGESMASRTNARSGEQAWSKISKVVSPRGAARERKDHVDTTTRIGPLQVLVCAWCWQNAELFNLTYGAMVMQVTRRGLLHLALTASDLICVIRS
jgi:hypothetical protein